jgi:hypothetical protein
MIKISFDFITVSDPVLNYLGTNIRKVITTDEQCTRIRVARFLSVNVKKNNNMLTSKKHFKGNQKDSLP